MEGKGKAYAPPGYDYTASGELKKNGTPRWFEVEIKNFETNPDWHYKPFRKRKG